MKKEVNSRITAEEIRISMTKRKAAEKKRQRTVKVTVFVISVCLVIVVAILIIFPSVGKIDVIGNTNYSREQILEAAQISVGTNFVTLNGSKIEENIKNKLPGISKVKIKKTFPSYITVDVTETNEVFYVVVGKYYYSLDNRLNVVKKYDSFENIEIVGLKRLYMPDVVSCISGKEIVTLDSDIPEMIKQLYESLIKFDLLGNVTEINFTDKFNITFTLGVRYTVKLGNILECDTKLEFLCGIIDKLGDNEVGTIDFSDGEIDEAVFSRT